MFSNGNPIVADPGVGSYNNDYFNSEYRYKRWFTNSNAHSCPEINGYQQCFGTSFASSDEVCSVEERKVSMDIANAYPKEAGVQRLVRSCELKDGEISVIDDVTLEECGTYTFHLTLVNKPEPLGEGRFSIGDGRVLSYDSTLFTAEISRVENKCLPYDDLNIQHHWGCDCLWDLALCAKGQRITCKIIVN